MSLQDLEHLVAIENLLNGSSTKEQNGLNGTPDSTIDSQFQYTNQDVLHKKAITQDSIEKQSIEIAALLQESGNQIGGVHLGLQMMSPSSVAEQDIISSFGTINWDDFEDTNQKSLINDLKPATSSSVGEEEMKASQDDTGNFHSTPHTYQLSTEDQKCTDSSMSNEELNKIQEALEDSSTDIFPFSKFLNQNGDGEHDNTITDQNMDDLISIIENDQAGSSGETKCQNTEQVPCYSTNETQIPMSIKDIVAQDDIKMENNDDDVMYLNTGNQTKGLQYEIKFPSHNLLFKQETNPNFSTNNCKNYENKSHFPQMSDFKPPMNSSVVVEDSKAFHNNTDSSHSTYFPNQMPTINLPCIQVTGQHGMTINASNPGPLRTKVGRCSRDEVPLYLMQEPEDKQEKRRWRRAKTAYEHRVSKKNALDGNSKKIEDLQNELSKIKNQLKIVEAERDAFKNSFLVLSSRTSK